MSEIISGLSYVCRKYAKRELVARAETGWGWTIKTASGLISVSDPNITDFYFIVTPLSFFPERLNVRGFIGRVSDPRYLLNGERIVAFTMSDGDNFNFSDNICGAWRFLFGNGELDLTNLNRPSMNGDDILYGYGLIAEKKALIEKRIGR